ncbi:MAG: hypothetical protein DIZ80_04455 [endosymbiont of Galathealinum brachiosum]|uniref:DUF4845 domain-containing protein n=1 Tax=endosymbiont of Galathealinum brachiosum TaxID=2200906 RepID=A0A370DIH5_9GAMM|nr:MAG: hypothetical protein DIZ80_04455 [endosymbiont of Galathealinum brachiosum]
MRCGGMINKKQSGLTMISWAIIIAFIAVQGIMALRIIPVYLNYQSLKTIMDSMAVDPTVKKMGAKKISKLFRKRLKINNLYDLADNKAAFKFKKIAKGYHLTAKYEERGPIWGNLKFVADFEYEVDILIR